MKELSKFHCTEPELATFKSEPDDNIDTKELDLVAAHFVNVSPERFLQNSEAEEPLTNQPEGLLGDLNPTPLLIKPIIPPDTEQFILPDVISTISIKTEPQDEKQKFEVKEDVESCSSSTIKELGNEFVESGTSAENYVKHSWNEVPSSSSISQPLEGSSNSVQVDDKKCEGDTDEMTATDTNKCDQCEKTFARKRSLVRHQNLHTGDRLFKCEDCEKAFIQRNQLIVHLRTHTGEKPFKCGHCDKAYSAKSNLNRHLLLHSGVKSYKCEQCGKAFRTKSHLNQHISFTQKR